MTSGADGRTTPAPGRTWGAVAAALALSCLLALLMAIVLRRTADLAGSTTAPRVDEVVAVACAALALLTALWFCVAVLVAVLGHLPGTLGRSARRTADRLAPPAARRVAAVVVGAVALGSLVPADAVGGPSPVGVSAPAPGWQPSAPVAPDPTAELVTVPEAPAPGFVPTRPTVRRQADPRLVAAAVGRSLVEDEGGEVVVRRGDTLWDLARAHLGSGATDAEVATEWPRWYATNRAVIGADPDLILPGQVLTVPGHTLPPADPTSAPSPHLAPTSEVPR